MDTVGRDIQHLSSPPRPASPVPPQAEQAQQTSFPQSLFHLPCTIYA
ncbi:hypothetical protein CK203_059227 [Vitis vinifera]|uniref:Uncharacterized protein n=1 Tax=Vitis vinifera TaxID=29760 RepID=A0A438GEE5_VITVI|nr:hypothetical protein CK203_059227 [Vitis vinifera]